jgi:hypothetical protein
VRNNVLTVRDNEHSVVDSVGGNEVTCQTLPSLESVGNSPGWHLGLQKVYLCNQFLRI